VKIAVGIVCVCLAGAPPVSGQARGQVPPPPPATETVAPDIPGVVKGGTKVIVIKDDFQGTEGPIALPDGTVAFTEGGANRITRIDKDGKVSVYLDNTNGSNALAFDSTGRLITVQRGPAHVQIGVVAPKGRGNLRGVGDLAGRSIRARRGTPPWRRLERLRDEGIPLVLEDVQEGLAPEEIIARVADGTFELAVVDSHVLDIELTWRDDVDAAFPLGDPMPLVWAVRDSNPRLLAEVNRFLGEEYRGLFYNVIYNKYFGGRRIPGHGSRGTKAGELSPWDEIVRRQAEKYDLDWRLIVSQIYQESGADPEAVSFAGAVGLLQVLPRTAEQLGITGVEDPVKNIDAGMRYLAWLRERFEDDLPVGDRMWFALASYNAGHGHVQDARQLAADQGWDPDRWFGNVEQAMLLLSDPQHARTAQHGYCRGSEPVEYVREIRVRYEAYLGTMASEPARRGGAPSRL